MHQLKMIQDWGYSFIYLRQPSAVMGIDIQDHSYKDVAHTPIKNMVSTVRHDYLVPYWLVHKEPLWFCNIDNEEEGLDVVISTNYILEPFPKHLFEPYGWHDILATLDVCTNVHATKHCDEEGYDIMSCNMVGIVMNDKEGETLHKANGHEEN